MQTLFQKYGLKAIGQVVSSFYEKIEEAESLKTYFANINMDRLRDHQTDFMSQILGGPVIYDPGTLLRMHQGLNISNVDFDLVASFLLASLQECGVEPDDITTVMTLVSNTRQDIVSEGPTH